MTKLRTNMNKPLLSLIFLSISTVMLKLFLKWRYKKKLKAVLEEDNVSQYYHQCKFVDMRHFNCRAHLIERKECGEECSLVYEKEIVSFITSAKKSICMCMYIITLKDVIFAVINASKRGVIVRVITDKVMLKTDVMQKNFGRLEKQGMNIWWIAT